MGRSAGKGKRKKTLKSVTDSIDERPPKEFGLGDKISKLFFSLVRKKKGPPMKVLRAEKYEIKGLLCDGTFGHIMFATHVYTNVTLAAKLERVDTRCSQLRTEYEIYEILGSETPGFIKVYYYGPCEKLYNVLIMELLGPDLDDLFVACNEKFSLKTVLMIAMQIINIMKHVHSKHIIYRDVKPENFCIGHRYQNKEKTIYIIDFGLSKIQYVDSGSSAIYDIHRDYLIGTARYMSISAHLGFDQSKRDDLESLGYMLMYLLLGKLPWMGLSRDENAINHYQNIADMKQTMKPEVIVPEYPIISNYMNYVNGLDHDDEPDYGYMYNMIKDAFHSYGFSYDYVFDWTEIMNKKFLGEAIEVDPDD